MQHSIRIFLSSTFKDLQKERDYLVNKVFPALRVIAEERGIPFSWCDLRFGVASFEQDYVLKLCLNNIKQSSPSFVGLIGKNYGSRPEKITKKQLKDFKGFEGVPKMIMKRMGFTEIEMRYFVSQYSNKESFDFYFFVGEQNKSTPESSMWRRLLNKFDSLFMASGNDQLYSWKNYISCNTKQSFLSEWDFNEDRPVEDDVVYRILKKTIEQQFTTPSFPKEELLWNEQQTYLENLLLGTLKGFKSEIEFNNAFGSADILNLYSTNATGKTFWATSQIKNALKDGKICFYHFVGGSRCVDTPLTIWKNLMYQICIYLGKDFSQYSNIVDRDRLRKEVTSCLEQITADVLIVIDGFGDDVLCSHEHRNTFLSDFPDPLDNIRYIITSNRMFFESERQRDVEMVCYEERIKKFMELYSNSYDSYAIDKLTASNFCPKDLREAKHLIDEIEIKSKKDSEQAIVKANKLYESIADRISLLLSSDNELLGQHDQVFYEGMYNAALFLAMAKDGILESDVCNVCNINAEQWTILYAYLSPYLKSFGRIKIESKLAKQLLSKHHAIDQVRQSFINQLSNNNHDSTYTVEMLYQASLLKDKDILCSKLANVKVLNTLFDIDKDIIPEHLDTLENAGLMDDFKRLLDFSIKGENLNIDFICNVIQVFHIIFPRYEIAKHYVEVADSYVTKNSIEPATLLRFYTLKAEVFITFGQFNEALEIIELLDNYKDRLGDHDQEQLITQILFLKIRLYDNDFQMDCQKTKALKYYKQLIENHINFLEKDKTLDVLHKYIMLCRKQENVEQYITTFAHIFSNPLYVKKNSHLYWKHYVNFSIHKLVLEPKDAESETVDKLFNHLFLSINKTLKIYPYLLETQNNLCFVIELLDARTNKLFKKNNYSKYKENVLLLSSWIERLEQMTKQLYSKNSLDFVLASFVISGLYKKNTVIHPEQEANHLSKSLEYSLVSEDALNSIIKENNFVKAKLYHNRADIYMKMGNYDKALEYIDKAITAKVDLGLIYKVTYFVSIEEKIDIFLDYIKRHDEFDDYKRQVAKLINEYKQTANQFGDPERIEISIKKSNDFSHLISSAKNRKLALAYELFERAKRIHEEGQKELFEEEKNKVIEYLRTNQIEEAFSKTHSDYVNFKKDLLSEMESLVNAMNELNEILKKN